MILSPNVAIKIKEIDNSSQVKITQLPIKESHSSKYEASIFKVNNLTVYYRLAYKTPIKLGQFVTLYKKVDGINTAFDIADDIDVVIVQVRDLEKCGVFVFPKSVLIENRVLTSGMTVGKMALRVYPPWCNPSSKQAIKSQAWQVKYFIEDEDIGMNF